MPAHVVTCQSVSVRSLSREWEGGGGASKGCEASIHPTSKAAAGGFFFYSNDPDDQLISETGIVGDVSHFLTPDHCPIGLVNPEVYSMLLQQTTSPPAAHWFNKALITRLAKCESIRLGLFGACALLTFSRAFIKLREFRLFSLPCFV